MQILHWVSVLAFGLLVSAQQSPKELDIKTTHTPSDCTVKANKGDAIKVHYVRRKLFPRIYLGFAGCILTNNSPIKCLPYRPENYFPTATNLTRGVIRDLFASFCSPC